MNNGMDEEYFDGMDPTPPRQRRTHPRRRTEKVYSKALIWILGIVFAIAVLITAILTFLLVRDTVRAWTKPDETQAAGGLNPGVLPTPEATLEAGMVLQRGAGPASVDWDGKSRINILFVGLDYRDWQADDGPPRTDTMILFTLDPETKSAGMMSIPRDLWVQIPGYDYGKINQAYYFGEAYQEEGGGAGLAIKTVENLLGIPVKHYAQVDFNAFIRLIDEIGGVKVNVPEEIKIDLLGDGVNTIKTLQPGQQTLPGAWALAYARNRDTANGDFDRASRQQQVILGIRDRLLSLDMIPVLLRRSGSIYREVSDGINTNLTFDQLVKLAWAGKDIPIEGIHRGVISTDQTEIGTSPDGLWILIPKMDAIRAIRDEVFSTDLELSPVAERSGANAAELAPEEGARIAIQNGTYTAGLASETAQYLKDNRLNIVAVGNADQAYDETIVIDYSGKPYTLQLLTTLLNVKPERILSSYDPNSEYDVVVIVGLEWADNNLLP